MQTSFPPTNVASTRKKRNPKDGLTWKLRAMCHSGSQHFQHEFFMSLVNRVEAFLKQISLCSVHYSPWKQWKITDSRKRPENSDPLKPAEQANQKVSPSNYTLHLATYQSPVLTLDSPMLDLISPPARSLSSVYYSKQYHDLFSMY